MNDTTDGKRGFISRNPRDGVLILSGSNICLYALREASQSEAIYLHKQEYLQRKPDSIKARHHEQRCVGWQESYPQNKFRRIIAAPIPGGKFCNHKINYILYRIRAIPPEHCFSAWIALSPGISPPQNQSFMDKSAPGLIEFLAIREPGISAIEGFRSRPRFVPSGKL